MKTNGFLACFLGVCWHRALKRNDEAFDKLAQSMNNGVGLGVEEIARLISNEKERER